MDKKKTPIITIIFYILGILFLAVSAFMLISAVGYTKTYLASYDASFSDMWSNTLQYVIAQFVPYLGIGVVCLGIGKAIKEAANAKAVCEPQNNAAIEAKLNETAAALEKLNGRIKYLSDDIDTTREVLSIKIEEKEKRDAYRLAEMGRGLTAAMEALEVDDGPVKINVPVAQTADSEPEVAAQTKQKPRPQIFTVSRRMIMPTCTPVTLAAEGNQLSEINSNDHSKAAVMNKEEKAMKKYPQIFTMARKMVMPPCKK